MNLDRNPKINFYHCLVRDKDTSLTSSWFALKAGGAGIRGCVSRS